MRCPSQSFQLLGYINDATGAAAAAAVVACCPGVNVSINQSNLLQPIRPTRKKALIVCRAGRAVAKIEIDQRDLR